MNSKGKIKRLIQRWLGIYDLEQHIRELYATKRDKR